MNRILLIIVVVIVLFPGYGFADDQVKALELAHLTRINLGGV